MAEMRQMMEDMKVIYGLNRREPTQPKEISFLFKDDRKLSVLAKNFETGTQARSEVEKVIEIMRDQGVDTTTLFEDTTEPILTEESTP